MLYSFSDTENKHLFFLFFYLEREFDNSDKEESNLEDFEKKGYKIFMLLRERKFKTKLDERVINKIGSD